MKKLTIALLSILAASSAVAGKLDAQQELKIEQVYARESIPGQNNSAAYFILENKADHPHAIVKVETPIASMAQLHISKVEDGVASMEPLENIPVTAHGTTTLKPGGMHVMLMGLDHELKRGEKFPLTLTFEDNTSTTIDVPVRGLG